MADRKTWGNWFMIGGGVAFGIGLLLRLTWSRKLGTGEDGAKPRGKCEVWLRPAGLYLGTKKTTIDEVISSCDRVALSTAGDSNYGELVKVQDALRAAGIPMT